MKSVLSIPAVFLALLSVSCSSVQNQARPLWADDEGVLYAYPSENYIARLGYGESAASAKAFSDAELARYFEHSVQTTTQASQTMTNASGKTTSQESVLQRNVTINSDLTLFAVGHTQPWLDKTTGQYIACSYINRREAWKIYEKKLTQSKKEFDYLYDAAIKEEDLLKKISRLKSTNSSSQTFVTRLDFAQTLYPPSEEFYTADRDRIASIQSLMESARMNCVMNMIVSGDKDNRIRRIAESFFVSENFIISSKSYVYTVSVSVEPNKTYHEQSITAEPGITVAIHNGKENLFTYNKNLPRIAGFTEAEALVDKKIYDALESELNASFAQALREFLE